MHCNFSEWLSVTQGNTNTVKSCSLIYGPMQSFNDCNAALRNKSTSVENFTVSNQDSQIVIIHFAQIRLSTDDIDLVYCFIAKGTVTMKTIAIEGTFKWGEL